MATPFLRICLISGLALSSFLTACGDDAVAPTPPTPIVTIVGEVLVPTHTTLKLVAMTIQGTDSGYLWTSSDEHVAVVAADGTVSGMTAGTATITAKGKDTGKSATHGVVVSTEIPNLTAWAGSAHANAASEPFRHWDTATPAEIPSTCAKCHSSPGFKDFIGADGSTVDERDTTAPIGTTMEC